jgi:hypothetical protein
MYLKRHKWIKKKKKNPRSRGSHESALAFHRSMTAIFDTHVHARVILVWSRRDCSLGPRQRARDAVEPECTIHTTPLGDFIRGSPKEAYLRQSTRQKAFDQWEAEWVRNSPHEASMSSRFLPLLRITRSGWPLQRPLSQTVAQTNHPH